MKSDAFMKAAKGDKPHHLLLYLPSQRRDGSAIGDFEEIADRTAQMLTEHFGGMTSYPATGYFKGSQGIQKETVQVLEFYCPQSRLVGEQPFIRKLVMSLRRELSQESMALSVNGSLLLFSEGGEDSAP
ncbi:MAG: hypothetical protein EOP86_01810 [Verrucomicrobiaceae bacterium]|nr:MAG: hypothetical protein EOP86_01810 [Verrucomicrobiaceae bacterium]